MSDSNTTNATNATNATTACYGYCQYRLPCGYCKEIKSMCPYAGSGTMTMQVNCCDNSTIKSIDDYIFC